MPYLADHRRGGHRGRGVADLVRALRGVEQRPPVVDEEHLRLLGGVPAGNAFGDQPAAELDLPHSVSPKTRKCGSPRSPRTPGPARSRRCRTGLTDPVRPPAGGQREHVRQHPDSGRAGRARPGRRRRRASASPPAERSSREPAPPVADGRCAAARPGSAARRGSGRARARPRDVAPPRRGRPRTRRGRRGAAPAGCRTGRARPGGTPTTCLSRRPRGCRSRGRGPPAR